ncbi:MAG: diacylglycerol kinase [Patescibacteria group bacterium]
MTLDSLKESFAHAWRGLRLAFASEKSFRLQTLAAACVLLVVLLLPLHSWERVILLLATAAILVLELVNSVVERLVDLFKPRLHSYVKDIKDMMAAAVLLSSAFALVIGLLILLPYLAYLRRYL